MSFFSLPLALDLIVKATIVLAAAALAASVLRRASASARHFVWTLGLLSALAVPALTLSLPRWELPIVRIAAPVSPVANAPALSAPALGRDRASSTTRAATVPSIADSVTPVPAVTGFAGVLPSWPALAVAIWMLGAAAIVARMLLGLIAVQWMARRTRDVTDASWLEAARARAADLGLRHVRFLRGAAGTMPMAWGVFRPAVLMPADADEWPAHRVRVVLLHELAHVKRRDCLTHLIAQLTCALYWFNPLAWVAARRLRSERERACDDLVLAAGTRGSDYADQLLDIARVMSAGRFPAVFAGASLAMAKRSQLEGRLIAILDPSVTRHDLSRARAVAAAALFAIVMLTVASVQPWAEERAAVNAGISPADPDPAQYPRDAQTEASLQTSIQGAVQSAIQNNVQGRVQGDVQGRIQGEVQSQIQGAVQGGIAGGVPSGVAGGVAGGMVGGVAGGVVSSVVDAVIGGIANGVAGVAQDVAMDMKHERQRDRDGQRKERTLDPRTVNALMEALKDTDKDVRETAMSALVRLRDPRMFEPLVQALRDLSADVREQAAFGLGQLRDARAIEPLAAAIKDQNASVREQVVFALGQLRAAGAIDALSIALHDSSQDVREQAAFALGQIRDKRSVESLISALKDSQPDVREQAAFALGQLRDARAVDALVIALKDSHADVREQAAFALGQIGDARAIDGLTAALKDTSASVRQQAAFALAQIR